MRYSFTQILSTDTIGDSLSAINSNYINIDQWTASIQLSAEKYWLPLVNFFQSIQSSFEDNITYATAKKPSWDSVRDLVIYNRDKWIEPLVIVYPQIVPTNQVLEDQTISTSYYTQVTNWLNNNFPALENGLVVYPQYQKAYVYLIKQEIAENVNIVKILQNYANCYTSDQTVCAQCLNEYTGIAACSNGNMICDGQSTSCSQCETVPCLYPQTGTHNYNPSILNYLNINFQDLREATDISCFKYEIQDCKWTFDRQI